MLVKTSLVAVVILAGLLSQSGATDDVTLQDDSNLVPGFSFSQVISLFSKLFMSSLQGLLQNTQEMQNLTAWQATTGQNSTSITQTISFPTLKAMYPETKATMGFLKSRGAMVANMGGSTFDMVMTATPLSNGTCQLDIKVLVKELTMVLDMTNLGIIGSLISPVLSVVTGLVTLLVGILTGVLGPLLSGLIGADVFSKLNTTAICEQILNGSMSSYPDISNLINLPTL